MTNTKEGKHENTATRNNKNEKVRVAKAYLIIHPHYVCCPYCGEEILEGDVDESEWNTLITCPHCKKHYKVEEVAL